MTIGPIGEVNVNDKAAGALVDLEDECAYDFQVIFDLLKGFEGRKHEVGNKPGQFTQLKPGKKNRYSYLVRDKHNQHDKYHLIFEYEGPGSDGQFTLKLLKIRKVKL
ncbi:MAG: hypothetical protein SV765_03760 [Pseudomonadota bacterium]|nr:hypothetical protein [Pseudomonadota bacterium]